MRRLLGGIADGDFLARIDGITLAARRHVAEICGVELFALCYCAVLRICFGVLCFLIFRSFVLFSETVWSF